MIIAMPLTIISGLLVAVLMFHIIKGRQLIQTINFLPYITMPVAIGLIFANMFNTNIGAVNGFLMRMGIITDKINWLGDSRYAFIVVILICIWKNFGYFMVLYLSGLSTINNEYYDAAKVDGANAVQVFLRLHYHCLGLSLLLLWSRALLEDFSYLMRLKHWFPAQVPRLSEDRAGHCLR